MRAKEPRQVGSSTRACRRSQRGVGQAAAELLDPHKVVAYSPSRLHPRIALTQIGAVRG